MNNQATVSEKLTRIDNAVDRIRVATGTVGEIIEDVATTVELNIKVEEKDVNFYDYDGTLLYSYTAQEFAGLTSMPVLPTHTGLTTVGWNWSLADAKSYVLKFGGNDIGALYATDDGKTRVYIELNEYTLHPYLSLNVKGTVEVNWGDGTAVTQFIVSGNNYERQDADHEYSSAGSYIVSITAVDDSTYQIVGLDNGQYNGSYLFYGGTRGYIYDASKDVNAVYRNCIKKIELGNNCYMTHGAFGNCQYLESISFGNAGITYNAQCVFYGCFALKGANLSQAFTSLGTQCFYGNSMLKYISFAPVLSSISERSIQSCVSLRHIYLPESLISIGNASFSNTILEKLILPDSVATTGYLIVQDNNVINELKLPEGAFNGNSTIIMNNCRNMTYLKFPKNVINIGECKNNYNMRAYDFSEHEVVPTLKNASNFENIPATCQIIVPDALYEDWVADANWSTYATNIVKVSEA